MPTSKVSSTSGYHHVRSSQPSKSRPFAARRSSEPLGPDASHLVKYPDVEGLEQARAKVLSQESERRGSKASKSMATSSQRKSHSDSRTYTLRESYATVREGYQDLEPEHRNRRRSSRHDDGGKDLSTDRPRSRAAVEAQHTRREGSHREGRDIPRRDPSRRPSRDEEDRHRLPVKREARPVELPIRSTSVREPTILPIFRPFLGRSQSSARPPPSRPPSALRAASAVSSERPPPYNSTSPRLEKVTSKSKGNKPGERSPSVLAAFKSPKPAKAVEKTKPCLICMTDEPASKCPTLKCSHNWCHGCLRNKFKGSINDETQMPPKCCDKTIPLGIVEKLLKAETKKEWNRKYKEFTTKHDRRIYCPNKSCLSWIPPQHIHRDKIGKQYTGRRFAVCPECSLKVCASCQNKWHPGGECTKDKATQELLQFAETQKEWQKCGRCGILVIRDGGCNHMTCTQCGFQFCIHDGNQWQCPVHGTYDQIHVDEDREAHRNGRDPAWVAELRNEVEHIPADPAALHAMLARDHVLAERMQAEQWQRPQPQNRQWQGRYYAFVDNPPQPAPQRPTPAPNNILNNEDFFRRAADALSATLHPIPEIREQAVPPPPMLPHQHTFLPNTWDLPRPARGPTLRQRSTTGARQVNVNLGRRVSERVVPRRQSLNDYAAEAETHRPISRQARASILAGIIRGETGDRRVDEWRRHVDPL